MAEHFSTHAYRIYDAKTQQGMIAIDAFSAIRGSATVWAVYLARDVLKLPYSQTEKAFVTTAEKADEFLDLYEAGDTRPVSQD